MLLLQQPLPSSMSKQSEYHKVENSCLNDMPLPQTMLASVHHSCLLVVSLTEAEQQAFAECRTLGADTDVRCQMEKLCASHYHAGAVSKTLLYSDNH